VHAVFIQQPQTLQQLLKHICCFVVFNIATNIVSCDVLCSLKALIESIKLIVRRLRGDRLVKRYTIYCITSTV